MKSTKGFTLIELLAVIVILAIIALIATPIVLGVVDTARKGAAENSVLGFVDAVEKQVMINELEGDDVIANGTYTVSEDTNGGATISGTESHHIDVKGNIPTGSITLSAGQVGSTTFTVGTYTVSYTKETGKASAQ